MVHAEGAVLSGRYRLQAELGRGGMSTVHRARDESLGRDVAIKIFSHGLTDAEGLARHREEVQLLASLSHPGLVTLFDAATDEEADSAYLVMELIEGDDLRRRLDEGPLPPAEAAVIGRQLAEALAYTHARGVVHRDVKPGNILLPRRGGEVTGAPAKLADFGIARIVDGARLTATGTVVGTAGYFSPEQALGLPLTGASDIYSLGLVLLEALTGERAFPGSAAESMAARINRDPRIPAELDAGWTELLSRMTARSPEARPGGLDVGERLGLLAAQPAAAPTGETESLDPTMRYPTAETVPESSLPDPESSPFGATQPEQPTGPAPASADATASEPARAGVGMLRRRLPLVIAALVAALVVVVTIVAVAFQSTPDSPAPPDYPAVEGELGESIEQLQRSVEP